MRGTWLSLRPQHIPCRCWQLRVRPESPWPLLPAAHRTCLKYVAQQKGDLFWSQLHSVFQDLILKQETMCACARTHQSSFTSCVLLSREKHATKRGKLSVVICVAESVFIGESVKNRWQAHSTEEFPNVRNSKLRQ